MVAAQTPLIEPSVALGCLTPTRDQRGTPEYPFDIRLTYFQPQLLNFVGQLDNYNSERLAFLDWMKQTQLDLSARMQDAAFGDQLALHILCGKLKLDPNG